MSRARNPNVDREIQIEILNWNSYGHKKVRSPHFIMIPTVFFTEEKFDLSPPLFRFFANLIYLAARQNRSGTVSGSVHYLSRKCSCSVHNVLPYVSELIERQIIQYVTENKFPILEENREDKNRPNSDFLDRVQGEVYELVPSNGAKLESFDVYKNGIAGEDLESARKIFRECIFEMYPEKYREFEQSFEYCRKIIRSLRDLLFMQNAIAYYLKTARWDVNTQDYFGLQSLNNFCVKETWISVLSTRFNGETPKKIDGYRSLHNISYQIKTVFIDKQKIVSKQQTVEILDTKPSPTLGDRLSDNNFLKYLPDRMRNNAAVGEGGI